MEGIGTTNTVRLSVVIPLFNEEETVITLLDRVESVLSDLGGGHHEIICVDDGSTDHTLETLLTLRSSYPQLKILALSRNFGHQAALTAGLEESSGDVVLVMDGDLQDDPVHLFRFLEIMKKESADVVYAIRKGRPDGVIRRVGYNLHYRLMAFLSETPTQVDSGDFALLSRRVVSLINSLPERQRYIRGLRAWVGMKQVGVDVDRDDRVAGVSKYSFSDLLRLSLDAIFAFSRVPLRVATLIGVVTVLAGTGYGAFVLFRRLTGTPPQGFATLALLQIVFSGVLLVVLGVIGEYVGRIYDEVKKRPVYIVRRRWGFGDDG